MGRKRIIFVHTTGAWWDHRYYFKQMPALQRDYADITYLIKEDKTLKDCPFNVVSISERKVKWTRVTGGINLFFYLLRANQDAIQLCNIELLPVGIILGLFSRKKVFYDCREDHYHAMLHSKVWFPKWFRYILGRAVIILEYLASKTLTGFIDSDPAIYALHRFIRNDKKMIFYNMPLKEQFFSSDIDRSVKRFDFVVLGSMSIRTGVLDVVNAIAILNQNGKDVNLKLIGEPSLDTTLFEQIQYIIYRNNLEEKIFITGSVPYSQVPLELADCKVGIVPLLNIPKFQNNIATKQFEYMASSMPIIASNLPPQQIFVRNNFNGIHYNPGDSIDLVNKMSYFINNPDEIIRMGNLAVKQIKDEWNAENQQSKLIDFYKLRMVNKSYCESQFPPFTFLN